jgi:hypothetical protein
MSDALSVEDLLTLMGAMREHKIALLEAPGVKLALMPDGRPTPAAVPLQPEPSSEDARQVTLNARSRLEENRRARIEAQERLRRGPAPPGVSKLVETVFTEAKEELLAEDRKSVSSGDGSG